MAALKVNLLVKPTNWVKLSLVDMVILLIFAEETEVEVLFIVLASDEAIEDELGLTLHPVIINNKARVIEIIIFLYLINNTSTLLYIIFYFFRIKKVPIFIGTLYLN
jgi:hypothetical protein